MHPMNHLMDPDSLEDLATTDTELVELLCRHSVLDQEQAKRVVGEMLAFYNESMKDFVQRRHSELRASGIANADIYRRIQQELGTRRFVSDALSERQIRRIVYG